MRRFFSLLLLLCLLLVQVSSTEVKWHPNEDHEPLPLSQNQRNQLLQLEDAIRSSPDPQGTLIKVAEANQMQPEELVDLLNRNRQEMQAAGQVMNAGGAPSRNVWRIISSIAIFISQAATRHPKAFTLTSLTLILLIFCAFSAPRNGIVLSSGKSLFSKGPTTFLAPPLPFLQDSLPRYIERASSIDEDSYKPVEKLKVKDGTIVHKNPKPLKLAVTSQTTLHATDFCEQEDDDISNVLDLFLEHTSRTLTERELTEWAGTKGLRLVTQGRKRYAILVVKGLGDWNRYGLLPLKISHETEEEEQLELVLSTLEKGHFDAQIRVTAKLKGNSDLLIQTSLITPKKGRKPSDYIAKKIVEGINESIAATVKTKTRQSLARRSQSSRFKGSASKRATERRKTRFDRETEIEDMSADRRRRWQRSNPNAGSYRPSGDRMKSPNNAMY